MSERARMILELVAVGLAAGLEAVARELQRKALQGPPGEYRHTPPDF